MNVVTLARPRTDIPQTGLEARLAIRRGELSGTTAGFAPGYVQGNLAILPASLATDFLRFCQLNPKPCPLLAASNTGDYRIPALGEDLDIRTDLPRYRVFVRGEVIDEPTDIRAHWREDLVAFVIGCSFSFEEALSEAGIELRHISCGATVPMYRTNVPTVPAGPFHGPLVVSMRFPSVHGAPVHLGRPDLIGISDIGKPDWGDAVPINDNEIPVFWACGVTPQSVVAVAKPAFCITHYPGTMLVTDLRNSDYAIM
jgi:uncharacterized protein YcsI (UPF0317 family)